MKSLLSSPSQLRYFHLTFADIIETAVFFVNVHHRDVINVSYSRYRVTSDVAYTNACMSHSHGRMHIFMEFWYKVGIAINYSSFISTSMALNPQLFPPNFQIYWCRVHLKSIAYLVCLCWLLCLRCGLEAQSKMRRVCQNNFFIITFFP